MCRKGVSALAYVVFTMVIIAALLSLGRYFRNALIGKTREASDVFGQGEVYDPYGSSRSEADYISY